MTSQWSRLSGQPSGAFKGGRVGQGRAGDVAVEDYVIGEDLIVLASLKEMGRGYESRNNGVLVGARRGQEVYPPLELLGGKASLLSP